MRPVLIKLGGSVLTDKTDKPRFKKAVCKRLLSEIARIEVPAIIMHGAGSFGHGPAKAHHVGRVQITAERRAGVSATLAGAGLLHAEVVQAAADCGLSPISVPLHLDARSELDELVDLPVQRIHDMLEEGHTPIVSGTLVRDDKLGWRVASADEIMACLAAELEPRLAVFATDVDGVYDKDPARDDAKLVPVLNLARLAQIDTAAGRGDDVTGRMAGKLERAFAAAAHCPTWIINGTTRGRLQDVLKGKSVPGTRLEA